MTTVCLEVEVEQIPLCLEVETDDPAVELEVASPIVIEEAAPPEYEGQTVFIPTQYMQTVPVSGLLMKQDIAINPIPSNYGLITWNGSTLTVS